MLNYSRRATWPVNVGRVTIGGGNPVAIQSMTNTDTLDTEASVAQCASLAAAGADIVRLTAQGTAHAVNLGEIRSRLRAAGVDVPLVADIHFNPAAAYAAAERVEKVRINPGNFADPGRTFRRIEYTDADYAAELERLRQKVGPFLDLCHEHGTAVRIGVNHGSLSDRIMSRYGDTPAGMVESAMEFLRVAVERDFRNVVISVKASNVGVMVTTVRMLVAAMEAEHMHFPLHLGVTEAGDADDGRVKSAVGIGTLLGEGIGDTIRVSLSEPPEHEIPVARALVDYIAARAADPVEGSEPAAPVPSQAIGGIGGGNAPAVVGLDIDPAGLPGGVAVVTATGANLHGRMRAALADVTPGTPVVLHAVYPDVTDADTLAIQASADLGPLLLDGYGDAVWIDAPAIPAARRNDLALTMLQATRRRISRTEYIACPSCGRTLFDLPGVLAEVKAATSHLKGLKIGVMGCVVNGPGEMADADYGYVGAAKGHVSLYKGKTCVEKNIPADRAIERLVAIIKENGDWHDA